MSESVRVTEDFDPDEVVEIRMGIIKEVLEQLGDLYDEPVVVGGMVIPKPGVGEVNARIRRQIGVAMLTLFYALPEGSG